jgi:hypothetical protein
MKKTIIFPILFLLFTSNLMAGEFTGIGIKLGYNSSIFTGNDIPGKGINSATDFHSNRKLLSLQKEQKSIQLEMSIFPICLYTLNYQYWPK